MCWTEAEKNLSKWINMEQSLYRACRQDIFLQNGFFQISDLSLRFIGPAQRQVMESQRGRVTKTWAHLLRSLFHFVKVFWNVGKRECVNCFCHLFLTLFLKRMLPWMKLRWVDRLTLWAIPNVWPVSGGVQETWLVTWCCKCWAWDPATAGSLLVSRSYRGMFVPYCLQENGIGWYW